MKSNAAFESVTDDAKQAKADKIADQALKRVAKKLKQLDPKTAEYIVKHGNTKSFKAI